jgi:hypothetical protein
MSFKVSKIVIGRGKTTTDEKQSEWTRRYYEVEAVIEDEHSLELAKGSIEALLDIWLEGKTISQSPSPLPEKLKYDMSKVRWEQAQGTSGPYEKSSDVGNLDFKGLLKDVQAHDGKMAVGEYFVWAFQNGGSLGRKKRKPKGEEDKPIAKESSQDAKNIVEKFPEDLRDILSFECQADAVIIKPRQFLGSENFAKTASIVKTQGGNYVSAGKGSHFRIPIKASK